MSPSNIIPTLPRFVSFTKSYSAHNYNDYTYASVYGLLLWHSLCHDSSSDSLDECRLAARWPSVLSFESTCRLLPSASARL